MEMIREIRCPDCGKVLFEIEPPVEGVVLKSCKACQKKKRIRFNVIGAIQFCSGVRVCRIPER
jgi:hypothetical protein